MTTLYRGGELTDLRAGVYSGRMDGIDVRIYRGALADTDYRPERKVKVQQSPWAEEPEWSRPETTTVVGGVTDNLNATRRFRKEWSLVAVLDGSQLPFEPVEYTYEFFDNRPGALTQIITSANGEYRDYREGLWGLVSLAPVVDSDAVKILWNRDQSGPERLPATSPESIFADEGEWIHTGGAVDTADAVEGTVSVMPAGRAKDRAERASSAISDPSADRAAAWLHTEVQSRLPRAALPLYVLLVTEMPDTLYPSSAIEAARGPDGLPMTPSDVPPRFRNG